MVVAREYIELWIVRFFTHDDQSVFAFLKKLRERNRGRFIHFIVDFHALPFLYFEQLSVQVFAAIGSDVE